MLFVDHQLAASVVWETDGGLIASKGMFKERLP